MFSDKRAEIVDRTGRMTRWIERMQRFNYTMEYIKTDANNVPDLISRTQISDVAAVHQESLREAIQRSYANDPTLRRIVEAQSAENIMADEIARRWSVENGLIFANDSAGRKRIVVGPGRVRKQIIADHHDATTAAHPGINATIEAVRRRFTWPRMPKQVDEYVRTCHSCARHKVASTTATMMAPPPVTAAGQRVHIDFAVGLKPSSTYSQIMVCIDAFSKISVLIPLKSSAGAKKVAEAFIDEYAAVYGLPTTIVTDRDPRFNAQLFKAVTEHMGVSHAMTSAYNPQANGQVERSMRTVKTKLVQVCNRMQQWHRYLKRVQYALNNVVHNVTERRPFDVQMRWPVTDIADLMLGMRIDNAEVHQDDALADDMRMALDMAHAKNKMRVDGGKTAEEIKPGDFVYVSAKHYGDGQTRYEKYKSARPKYIGQYQVLETRPNQQTYRIDFRGETTAHDLIHARHLKKADVSRAAEQGVETIGGDEDIPLSTPEGYLE